METVGANIERMHSGIKGYIWFVSFYEATKWDWFRLVDMKVYYSLEAALRAAKAGCKRRRL